MSGNPAGDGATGAGGGASPAWFRDWFGEDYLSLYPHRDEEEASRAVRLFARSSELSSGCRVLDLACGAGRHLTFLAEAGFRPVGLDLSRPLLLRARERAAAAGGAVPLVRADMRGLPLADGAFDGVVQFFTSFGYFARREEDVAVLREIRRVLRVGGWFLLDFLHADHVRDNLVPEDETRVSGRRVRQRRWIEEGRVVKRIEIEPAAGGTPEVYHERVRLYEPRELEEMLRASGLEGDVRYGDYRGAPFGPDSPRLIIVGRAA